MQAIDSGWISSTGEFVQRFESSFAHVAEAKHALSCANGTVALHLALLAAGIGDGDEVIVPSLTYIATANAVRYCNATPIFADVDESTWCLSPEKVEACVTPRTRAIIAVHLYGHPAAMKELRQIALRAKAVLIEDAAEAPFATLDGHRVGNLGDISTFSFYGNKVLSSGEGGAVCTSSDEHAALLRQLRGQGMDLKRRYYFPIVGYNYRLTNVACAILCAQLERASELIAARREVYRWYDELLADESRVTRQPCASNATISPWLYSVLVHSSRGRDAVMQTLGEQGVETRPFFIPIHTLPPYAAYRAQADAAGMSVTVQLANNGINLPTYPGLTRDEVAFVVDKLRRAL